MYKYLSLLSAVVRQFYVPNPFEVLEEGWPIIIGEISMILPPVLLNIIAEPLLHIITYFVVSFYYTRSDNPEVGSFLYLIFYFINTGLVFIIALLDFELWAVIFIFGLYIGIHAFVASKRVL